MATYRTDEQLEDVGRNFLRLLGIEYQIRPDMMTIIMKLKHKVPSFNYRRVPDAQMPQAEAYWYSDEFELGLRESTFAGIQRGDAHCRFVVAHELSHYALGHKGSLNRLVDGQQRLMSAALVKHQESDANRLAVIILAPEHLVPDNASAEEIASTFGLNLKAAILRKDEVDRIRRHRRGELRPLPESIKEMLREAKRDGIPIRTQLDE
jgi:hypothetical protein